MPETNLKQERIQCAWCDDWILDIKDARKKLGKGWVDIGCWWLWIFRGIKIKNM